MYAWKLNYRLTALDTDEETVSVSGIIVICNRKNLFLHRDVLKIDETVMTHNTEVLM